MDSGVEVARDPVIRQLLYIWSFQTAEEQKVKESKEKNNVGFNGLDADILTSIADYVIKRHKISVKQYNIVCKRITKYHRQLRSIPEDFNVSEILFPTPARAFVYDQDFNVIDVAVKQPNRVLPLSTYAFVDDD